MKILLVEDDQNKSEQILEFLRNAYSGVELIEKKSYHSALKEILTNTDIGVVVLDMSLPNYDVTPIESGGRKRVFAGREILVQMQIEELKIPVVVVTQYDVFGEEGKTIKELKEQLLNEFGTNYLGMIYYSASSSDWKGELEFLLKKVV